MGHFSDLLTRDPDETSPLWAGPDHDPDDWQPPHLTSSPSSPKETPMTTDPQHGIRIDHDGAISDVTWTRETALATMQEAVGGPIELIPLPGYGLTLVCHDEARLRADWAERVNQRASDLYLRGIWATGSIVGPVLIISSRVTDDGASLGLSRCGLSDVRCWYATGWLAPEGHEVR